MQQEDWLSLDRSTFMDRWYSEEYATGSYSGSTGVVQRWMHSSLERGYTPSTFFARTIELGGNVGEHLPFVHHAFDEYMLSDIAARETSLPEMPQGAATFLQADAADLPFDDGTFDRVLHTCLLHHVGEPEDVLGEIRRVLKTGGTADLFLPSDPGLAFRAAKRLGPVRAASRRGLGDVKKLVDARDHRNHVAGLAEMIRHTFRQDQIRRRSYPVPGLTWNSSLWFAYRITRA